MKTEDCCGCGNPVGADQYKLIMVTSKHGNDWLENDCKAVLCPGCWQRFNSALDNSKEINLRWKVQRPDSPKYGAPRYMYRDELEAM